MRHPLVEEILFYIDMFQELHASTTSLILDFGCIFFLFLFSLVLSSLSKCNVIAFMLHLRGGVKGIIVNVLVSRVWDVSHVYIALWASLNTYTVHSLFLSSIVTWYHSCGSRSGPPPSSFPLRRPREDRFFPPGGGNPPAPNPFFSR